MRYRLHPGLLLALIVLICVGAILLVALFRSRTTAAPADLLAHLPAGDAAVLSIDVQALRRSGVLALLAGSKVTEEPEYKAFVVETGFDYGQDLDSVIVAFHRNAVYFLLRGRFDWRRLAAYVASQDGVCRNAFCRAKGSTPKRNISFFPLRSDVMALAVSADTWAASQLMSRKPRKDGNAFPEQPLWLLIPASVLRDEASLPAGTRLFAKAMAGADRIVLSLGPKDDRFEAVLDVTCHSARDAEVLSVQLEGVTRLLRNLIARENKQPNPRDLSGVLAAGRFERLDMRVLGRWPVERAFLESLASGSL